MNQPPQRASDSRTRIIEAARQVLIEGSGHFELADLARRAGVSVGLPYHRFGSKSGVMAAVVTEFYDGIRQALDLGDFGELDWSVRERERLRRLVEYLYGDPLAVLIISSLGRDPEVAALEANLWSETIEAAARNLAKAQARGHIAPGLDPALAAAMICGGIRHAIGLSLRQKPRRSSRALVSEIWNVVANALRLGSPGAQPPHAQPAHVQAAQRSTSPTRKPRKVKP